MRQPPPTNVFFSFNHWQCASVGASGRGGGGGGCAQPCRTDGDHIKIFKPNALASDRGLDVAWVAQHSKRIEEKGKGGGGGGREEHDRAKMKSRCWTSIPNVSLTSSTCHPGLFLSVALKPARRSALPFTSSSSLSSSRLIFCNHEAIEQKLVEPQHVPSF